MDSEVSTREQTHAQKSATLEYKEHCVSTLIRAYLHGPGATLHSMLHGQGYARQGSKECSTPPVGNFPRCNASLV